MDVTMYIYRAELAVMSLGLRLHDHPGWVIERNFATGVAKSMSISKVSVIFST